MNKAILTRKLGMTQIFGDNGELIPVTVLEAGPCVVTQVKTVENDGYEAVQVGFVDDKEKVTTKDANARTSRRQATSRRPAFPQSVMFVSSVLTTLPNISWLRKSRPTSSLKAIM